MTRVLRPFWWVRNAADTTATAIRFHQFYGNKLLLPLPLSPLSLSLSICLFCSDMVRNSCWRISWVWACAWIRIELPKIAGCIWPVVSCCGVGFGKSPRLAPKTMQQLTQLSTQSLRSHSRSALLPAYWAAFNFMARRYRQLQFGDIKFWHWRINVKGVDYTHNTTQ